MVTQQAGGEVDSVGYVGRVPVRNLWLLMLYASDLFRTRGVGKAGLEDNPDDLPALVGEILAHAVELRQRRCFNPGYRSRDAVVNRLRGRIDVLRTERHQLLDRGLVACRFDELTIDTHRNRFVRAGLEAISKLLLRMRQKDLSARCRALARGMRAIGVTGETPSRAQMSTDRLGRNDNDDRLMVSAAALALDLALLNESAGTRDLVLPDRDEVWARRLFERAVGGFYEVVLQRSWRVCRGQVLRWPIEQCTAGVEDILPSMKTDVVLDHHEAGRRIVIDTKFTSIVARTWYRDESLNSGYLYQIYAYLRSQVGRGDPLADSARGLLLHPSVEQEVDETVVMQGHAIRFATVDLTLPAAAIRQRLLALSEPKDAW